MPNENGQILNLPEFLTNIADTIRTKKGYTNDTKINAQDFKSEILSIETAKEEEEKVVDVDFSLGNQVVVPSGNKVMSKVTITKPENLLPANIRKNVVIGGVVGTMTSEDLSGQLIDGSITEFSNNEITKLRKYAFTDCTSLTSVNIPQVTSVGYSAFDGCTSLTSIYCPQITSIDLFGFNNCSSLTSVDVSKVTSIKQSAFCGCSKLTSIDLPLVTELSSSTFENCSSLTSVNLPLLTKTGYQEFRNCRALTSIDLPKLTSIRNYLFTDCTSLTSVNIPNTTYVGYEAFSYCSSLTSVSFPTLNGIDSYSFINCYSLIKLVIEQTDSICKLNNTNAFNYCYHILGTVDSTYNPDGLKDGYIYVPASKLAEYKVATNWATYASQIIGHQDFNVGDTLPNYTTSDFTTQTWYSDEKLTNVVTNIQTSGKYYCRLEA